MTAGARARPIGALKTLAAFRAHVQGLGVTLPVDDVVETGPAAPLGQPYRLRAGATIGNRLCIHPMEGWDGTTDGHPSDLTRRRWRRFGESGAKLIWGGEAVAVRPDGRANPNQLMIDRQTLPSLRSLREDLVTAHRDRHGSTDDLLVGLQLTHSGRYARPQRDRPEPLLIHRHPILDARLAPGVAAAVVDDDGLRALAALFIDAAVMAADAGFAFVDVKHCHGYLAHELLGAHTRPGAFGGTLVNRTRFLCLVVEGIRRRVPGLGIAVRVSAFDTVPFRRGEDGRGVPEGSPLPYRWGFGVNADAPTEPDLAEPIAFLKLLDSLGIELCNITAGSPYYNPHLQRPALYPPSDGYRPPNDPLRFVAQHLAVTAALKQAVPSLFVVGTGYSYLQEFLPNVAQHAVRSGAVDAVGIGRLALSYSDFPADVLAGRTLDRHRLCRTFSDCTTGPRNGLVSGCYPLDAFYHERPEAAQVLALRPRANQDR
ncbi:MAG TPA: NADH:flavin oxidoreductase [Polyangia bacterium]|jgi:2,4-dienoyl-CoA reductase-like NADH-dependent reductase (Old Yellow Enzyme family)|nr:NADH:flavin oxidoreductase [Polyangia bacterium]